MSVTVTLMFLGFLPRKEDEQGLHRAYVMEMKKQNIFVIGIPQDADDLTQEGCPWQYGMLTRVSGLQWRERYHYYEVVGGATLLPDSYSVGKEILFKKASYPPTCSGQDLGFVRVWRFKSFNAEGYAVLDQIGGDELGEDRILKIEFCQPEIQEFLQKNRRLFGNLRKLIEYRAKEQVVLFILRQGEQWLVMNLFPPMPGGIRALLSEI